MCEDFGLCTYEKHHKSKISLFFHAMRSYRDKLVDSGYKVHYQDFNNNFKVPYTEKLQDFIDKNNITELIYYEIPDKSFEMQINKLIDSNGLNTILCKFHNL